MNNFGGDSERYLAETVLINDTAYRSIYFGYSCEDTSTLTPILVGYVRQEGQQVYFRLVTESQEFLLYDYSLQQGETFPFQLCLFEGVYMIDDFELYVQTVDSISTNTGWRKRIRFTEFDWIEGLGSTRGPLEYGIDMCTADLYLTLHCVRDGQTLVYQHPDAPICCFSELSVNDENMSRALYAAPNPAKAGGSIQLFGMAQFAEASLFDNSGRLLDRWKWQQGQPYQIPTYGLSPGLYMLHLRSNQQYAVQKLIVQ